DASRLSARRLMSATPNADAAACAQAKARLTPEKFAALPLRQRLILAAIDEIEEVGFERFSVRRVAAACGASCAAPYKHFKNRQELVVAILDYISQEWLKRQQRIIDRMKGASIREILIEFAVDYIRFLVENPRYNSVLMLKGETLDSSYMDVKARLSDYSKELLLEYCRQEGVDLRIARVKMYVVRSQIYGFALMFINNELPYGEMMIRFVRTLVEREFELPWTLAFESEGAFQTKELKEFLSKLGPEPGEELPKPAPYNSK
ncbi:MAG: TetR/AcrR family transcriptional regulator, partial [Thermoguttaceae bacterium]|nr:TetR/AcrR family transcriptional regulator [Thermoguttaceae bacterium]